MAPAGGMGYPSASTATAACSAVAFFCSTAAACFSLRPASTRTTRRAGLAVRTRAASSGIGGAAATGKETHGRGVIAPQRLCAMQMQPARGGAREAPHGATYGHTHFNMVARRPPPAALCRAGYGQQRKPTSARILRVTAADDNGAAGAPPGCFPQPATALFSKCRAPPPRKGKHQAG